MDNTWAGQVRTYANRAVEELQAVGILGDTTYLLTAHQGILPLVYSDDPRRTQRPVRYVEYGEGVPITPSLNGGFLDEQGNLFICGHESPIRSANLYNRKMELHFADDLETYRNYRSASPGPNGGYWVTTPDGALHITPEDTTYYAIPTTGLEAEATTFVRALEDGTVYLGTLDWLFRKLPSDSGFKRLDPRLISDDNQVGYISCLALPDRVLFGTNDSTVLSLSDQESSAVAVNIPHKGITAMLMTGDDFFFGTSEGVLYTGKLSGVDFTQENAYELNDYPFALALHYDSTLYVGGLNHAYALDLAADHSSPRVLPIPSAGSSSLLIDQMGQVWTAGSSGLYRYDPVVGSVSSYTTYDGKQSGGYQFAAAAHLADGRLIFPGGRGINIIDPAKTDSRLPLARPTITDLTVNGIPWKNLGHGYAIHPIFIEKLEVDYDQTDINIRLSARAYANPELNKFAYRLIRNGVEGGRYLNTSSSLQLSGLAPGSYNLEIIAANADGIWSNDVKNLAIQVNPPWYQSTPAYVAYAAALLALMYAVYRIRVAQITYREQLKTEKAEALQQAAETETSVLRLQMNPHFIFNSLNSIDDYILDREPIEAHDYLVLFAELMRDILNRSTQPLTRLDREIELVTRYVEAERRRIGEGLILKVEVAEELDDVSTYLPTMILQPFVENAIWHGIGHREGGGTITLRFRVTADQLIAEVEDDGRGRGGSVPSGKKHQSKALEITQRRLSMLPYPSVASTTKSGLTGVSPAAAQKNPRFEIIDLKNEAGQPSGTRVVLYLPRTYPEPNARRSD